MKMINTTGTEMSIERVTTLIEAYGGDTQNWPEQERAEAVACLESSPRLQQLLNDASELDAILQAGRVEEQDNEALLAHIVDTLPEQPKAEQNITKPNWMLGWPAAMAATLTTVVVVLVVMNSSVQTVRNEKIALQEMDYLLWQDVTGQGSDETSDEAPTDFISML